MWAASLGKAESLNPSDANAQDKVNIAQRLYKGKPNKGQKGGRGGKAFALHHCWVLLEHDEKWRTRNLDAPSKGKKSSNSPLNNEQLSSDDEHSDRRRSPTPSSVPSEKRPSGRKASKEKLKKGGEGAYKESIDTMMATRKELAADMKEFKNARWLDKKEMVERRMAEEERRAVAEERRAAAEERRVAAEAAAKMQEQDQRIMFMDPSNLDEKARAYFEIMRDQILARSGYFMGGNGGNGSTTDLDGGGTE